MFASSGASEMIIEELIEDIISKSEKTIKRNLKKIKEKYPEITEDDSLTISSYTYESKDSNFSPYRLLNTSLVSKNRKNGLEKISKYLYILLNALRKLKRYYPEPDNNYLYRCIRAKVNLMIDPLNKALVPYIKGNIKTFWGFTSTSPNARMTYNFLGEKNNFKSGTIFTLTGDVWGYDITLFNYFEEEEILLKPERKIKMEYQ